MGVSCLSREFRSTASGETLRGLFSLICFGPVLGDVTVFRAVFWRGSGILSLASMGRMPSGIGGGDLL